MLKAMRVIKPTEDKEPVKLEYTKLEAQNMTEMVRLLKVKGKDGERYVCIKEHGKLEIKETKSMQVSFLD